MRFVKLDSDYIDLEKVVSVSFDDDNLEISFFCENMNDFVLYISYDHKKDYLNNKRTLIKELICVSLDSDCEVVEC